MNKFILIVGLGVDSGLAAREQSLRRLAANTFGEYSYTPGIGGWTAPDGEFFEENTGRLEVYTDSPRWFCEAFARGICDAFNQQCVALEYTAAPDFGLVYQRKVVA
jgi:hypothetical protein